VCGCSSRAVQPEIKNVYRCTPPRQTLQLLRKYFENKTVQALITLVRVLKSHIKQRIQQ
jgi:hypothetical protein